MFKTRSIQTIVKSNTLISKRLLETGTKGHATWPLTNYIIKSYTQGSKNLIGWILAFLTVMVILPVGIVYGSDFIHKVPGDNGTEVQAKRIGWNKYETNVKIPFGYSGISKKDDIESD